VGELSREAEACASQQDYSCCVAKYEVILEGYPGASVQIQGALKRCRNEVSFGRLKSKADGLFSSNKYGEALLSYQQALRYKTTTTNAYCLNRVQACQLELNFSITLAKGDGLYAAKNYAAARSVYEEALVYKPWDEYSVAQKKKCVEALAKSTKSEPVARYSSRVGGVMIYVGGGRFTMGSNTSGEVDEQPEHEVELDGYYMGESEVTVGEYLAFCEAMKTHWPIWLEPGSAYHIETGTDELYKTRGYSRSSLTLPMVGVSYEDAKAYCEWLSGQDGGRLYSLPTEAQWEYAARGGRSQASYSYAGSKDIKAVGWTTENSGGKPHGVKGLSANGLGLYDLSGSVWEWCLDLYAADWYKQEESRKTNAENVTYGPKQSFVLRGGSWSDDPYSARVADRSSIYRRYRYTSVGFRVVASLSN